MPKQKITVKVTYVQLGVDKGKYRAQCPVCPVTKVNASQGRAAELVHGHMVGLHSADAFASVTVDLQN